METNQETEEIELPELLDEESTEQEIELKEKRLEGLEEEKLAEQEQKKAEKDTAEEEDRSGFIHGLSVGLGIGCITTFIVMWIAIFFTPQLPSAITYENLLSIFIYPLIYLLAVGLIALTAGIVREYYARKF
ncbi:MAG: hypothetical protein QXI91_03545 [Candidatus Bathyarchaeia archaeon]